MKDANVASDEAEDPWARPLSARLGGLLIALLLSATGVGFVWQASRLDFGTLGLPGPGLLPFALGATLSALAVAIFLRTAREDERDVVHIGHRNVLVVLAALVGAAAAFERMDTYLLLGAFTAVLLLAVAQTSLWKALLAMLLCMAAVYLVFAVALGVPLPTSDLWQAMRLSVQTHGE